MNLNAQLRRLLRFWGVDRAVGYTVIGRGWSILTGPITLLLLAVFLSPEQQGFYYTFTSILALQIFFELGLSFVLLQLASHEKAKLEWTNDGILDGDPTAKARLFSLLRMALAWYGIAAILVIGVVMPLGLIFFARHQPVGVDVGWQLPWILVVLVFGCNLFVSPIFVVLEGCGLVAEIAFVRIWHAVVSSLLFWLALSLHWGLFAAVVINGFGFFWGIGWLWFYKRSFLLDLVSFPFSGAAISWRREVWPFQWKIAISWLSGYFIFQLFNPVLFAFHGATAAGQMGMSLNMIGSISNLALAWVETKSAPFGSLIAKREFKKLDQMFFPCLWQSFSIVALGGVALWIVAFYLNHIHHPFSHRLLDPVPLGFLIATAMLNHIVIAEGVYLRAHKQDPFLVTSIIIGFLVSLSTYFLGKHFAATGMAVGYFTIMLFIGLGVGTWIFMQKRRLWQSDATSI
jgi:hypothetical protein